MARPADVALLLQADAKRRMNNKSNICTHHKSQTVLETPKRVQPLDDQSKSLVYKQFLRDLAQTYTTNGVQIETMPLDREKCLEMSAEMGFVIPESKFDQELFYTLWKELLSKKIVQDE